MPAYRRVYDSRHLQADCQEPGSAPEPYAPQSSIPFYSPRNGMIYDRAIVAASYYLTKQVIAPGSARRYAHPHGSSTRGGSKSVRGRVRSSHSSGGRPAAGSQRGYSLGWDRQTDGRIAVSLNSPYGGERNKLPSMDDGRHTEPKIYLAAGVSK